MARHDFVMVPSSKLKLAVAKILKNEGFINDYEILKEKSYRVIKIYLKYYDKKEPGITGLERVSKPGMRIYVQQKEVPRVYGGAGVAVVSTSKGVMTGKEAWKQGIGGEILCYVW